MTPPDLPQPASPTTAPREGNPAGTSSLGERLVQLRRAAGLTQTQLAGEDLSPSYISLIEAGKRRPSEDVAATLAERLGCSVSMLLDGEPSERERRIELELSYCRLALTHGEADSARQRLQILIAESPLERRIEDDALLLLAEAQQAVGELRLAAAVLLPLFQRSVRGESHLPVSTVGAALCSCYRAAGDFHRLVLVGEQAIAATPEHLKGTDDYFRLGAMVMWGYHEVGDVLHASSLADGLIAEAERAGSEQGQAAIYWNASLIAQTLGRLDEALYLSQQALNRLAERGSSRDLARLRINKAHLILSIDPSRAAEALQLLEGSAEALQDLGTAQDLGVWETVAALAHLHLGSVEEAVDLATQAAEHLVDDISTNAVGALLTLGDTLAATGDSGGALREYHQALNVLDSAQESGREVAAHWREVADRLAASGELREAVRSYQRALDALSMANRFRVVDEAIRAAQARTRRLGSADAARPDTRSVAGAVEPA